MLCPRCGIEMRIDRLDGAAAFACRDRGCENYGKAVQLLESMTSNETEESTKKGLEANGD